MKIDKLELVRAAVRKACKEKGFDVDGLTLLDGTGKPCPASFTRSAHMGSQYLGHFSVWVPDGNGANSVQFFKDDLEEKAKEAAVHVSAYVQARGYEW